MSIKIIISDDHKLIREGLANLLEESEEIHILAEAENGKEVVEMAKKHKPDIILMDVSMPLLNGVEATREIKKVLPGIKIIALTMHSDNYYIKAMLEAGASGYIFKNSNHNQLIEAISTVYKGKKYLSDEITEILIKGYLKKDREDFLENEEELTERELEIIKLIASGKSTKEIAEELFISIKTIGTHKQKIYKKLKINSTAEITKYAIKRGLSDL